MEEVWKDIGGFEGLYQISNLGNVKSLNYCGRGYAKNLVPKLNCKGYLWVILYRGASHKCVLVHRLVGTAFIDNPNSYPFINHKDENPLNNKVDNLEWCTGSYNVQYSLALHPERYARFGHSNHNRRNRKKGIPYKHNQEIIQYSKSGEEIQRFPNIATACIEEKWRMSSLLDCCKGIRKTAYGYIWRFAS